MFKLALGALVSLLLMLAPASAATADTADGASAAPGKQLSKQVSKKPRAKRKDLAKVIADENRAQMVRRIAMVHGKRQVTYLRVRSVPAPLSAGDLAGLNHTSDPLELKSSVAYVLDQANSEVLFEKNAGVALPIASITKLMTGLIVVQAQQDMSEILTLTDEDIDREKHTGSRLKVGTRMSRGNLLHLALMSSENRAAAALGRN